MSDETNKLLTEIRDLQKEHLELYREIAQRSIITQEESVARQAEAVKFYRNIIIASVPLIVFIICLIIYLITEI